MRRALSYLILLALLSVAFAPAPFPSRGKRGVNLLVNGSFEEGPAFTNWSMLGVGNTSIKGWVVTRASIDIVDSYWDAAHGKRSIDLHGSPGYGGISQTFKTSSGRTYLVRFSLACNPDTALKKKIVGVGAAGKSASFTFDGTGKSHRDMGWQTKAWVFTAVDKQTTLELYTLTTEDNCCGPVIDDVSVREIK